MNFSLKVFGNQAQTVAKPERQADGSVKQNTEQLSRIVAKDENNNVFSFSLPYSEGKAFELDRVLEFELK